MADALATLLRLRRLGVDQARRDLAASLAGAAAAAREVETCREAIAREAGADLAALLPAWLPEALRAAAAARAHEAAQAGKVDADRAALAEAEAGYRAVEICLERRAAIARRAAARREQHRLDDSHRRRNIPA